MKKILLFALLLSVSSLTFAQKADSTRTSIQKNAEAIGQGGKNEIKLNLLFAILGMAEVSYERLLADNLGLGVSAFANFDEVTDQNFGVIPHFRLYFGAKKASGFFIEANTGIISEEYEVYLPSNSSVYPYYNGRYKVERQLSLGLGAAAGAKFLTRNGFLGEAYFGLGRTLGRNAYSEAYPRVGITIGKRF